MYISKFAFNAEILPVNVKIFMNKFEGKSKNVRRCLAMCRQIIVHGKYKRPLFANQKTTGKYWHGFFLLYLSVKRWDLI